MLTKRTASEAVAVANKAVISLWRVRTLLALLGGVVPHITYTQSRGVMSSALNALSIQTTGDAPTPSILSELASLSKLCTWEVARLHPSTVKSDMSAAMLNGPLTAVVENASQVPVSDTQEEANEGADGGPVARREANANVLRALLRAISTAYRSISTAIIARPPPRRTPDTKYKDEAKRFADLAAKLAAEDLVWPDAGTAAYCPAKGVVLKGGVDDNGDLPYALIAIKSTSDALKHGPSHFSDLPTLD